jgi:hypothetical protein
MRISSVHTFSGICNEILDPIVRSLHNSQTVYGYPGYRNTRQIKAANILKHGFLASDSVELLVLELQHRDDDRFLYVV